MPLTTIDDLVAARIKMDSAYSGRRVDSRVAPVTIQLEHAGEVRLYMGFDAEDLGTYAGSLEKALRIVGLSRRETLGIHDFGSSPVVYLASGLYMRHASRGATDRIGCTVVCNDGTANLAWRAVEILKYVRPSVFVVRSDCLEPLVAACVERGIDVSAYLRSLVVTRDAGKVSDGRIRRAAAALGVRVLQLLRCDAAMFFAAECPNCGQLHIPRDRYRVEIVDLASGRPVRAARPGRLVVTNLFAQGMLSIRMLTSIEGTLLGSGCDRASDDVLVSIA